jgi:hypothetical protein
MISCSLGGAEATSGTGAGRAGRQCGWLVLGGWLVLAALAGTVEARSHTEQADTSKAQATALRLRRWPRRGVSHSRVAPAR